MLAKKKTKNIIYTFIERLTWDLKLHYRNDWPKYVVQLLLEVKFSIGYDTNKNNELKWCANDDILKIKTSRTENNETYAKILRNDP